MAVHAFGAGKWNTVTVEIPGPPHPVEMRFELSAQRLVDAWLSTRVVQVTAGDLHIAREFLEQKGFRVEDIPGLLVRLVPPDGEATEMSREATVLVALRRLAALSRPETPSRVGGGSERERTVDKANAMPRPAKPARQNVARPRR